MEYLKRILQKNKQVQSRYNPIVYRLNVFLLFLIISLTVVYCLQINAVMNIGYEIAEYEKKIKESQNENQKLVYETVTIQSIKSIVDRAIGLGLVETDGVEYLSGEIVSVAKK